MADPDTDPSQWLPIYPSPQPRPLRPREGYAVGPVNRPAVPDLLATSWFFPGTLPLPQRTQRQASVRTDYVCPFEPVAVIHPLSWQPKVAGPLPRIAPRNRQEITRVDPTTGADATVASRLSWLPRYPPPERVRQRPQTALTTTVIASSTQPVTPPFTPCVELLERGVTVPTLLGVAVSKSDLIGEAVTLPGLVGVTVC